MSTYRVRFSPRRLGHLNIFVNDVERSAAFYRDICGFQEVFREPGISMIFMSNGNTHHDLGLMEITQNERAGRDGYIQVRPGQGKTPGLNHLGFEMETEQQLVEGYRRAKASDVAISRTTDHQIAHSVYMPDSEGHTLELYADAVSDWKTFYEENTGELISGHWDIEKADPKSETLVALNPDLYRSDASLLAAQKVAYAGLPVRDFARARAFYKDVVGLEVVWEDAARKFAVLRGTADGGCDVCLVGVDHFPNVRLLFGGIHLHDGKPIRESHDLLKKNEVPSSIVGDSESSCLIVLDPDGIPLVYSTDPSIDLMRKHGLAIVDEVLRLSSSRN